MIRRPPRSTLFPTRRSSDLFAERVWRGSGAASGAQGPQSRDPGRRAGGGELSRGAPRSEEHTSELQSQSNLVCRLLLEKKKRQIAVIVLHSINELHSATTRL